MTSATQKSKSILTGLQQKKPSYSRPNNQPIYQALFQSTNKEVQVAQGEDSCSKQQQSEVRTCPDQFSQQNLEILSLKIYSHNYPPLKGLFSLKNIQNCPQAGCLQVFPENQRKLTSDPERASDSLSLKTSSTLLSSVYVNFYRQKYFVGSRDRENIKETCNKICLK